MPSKKDTLRAYLSQIDGVVPVSQVSKETGLSYGFIKRFISDDLENFRIEKRPFKIMKSIMTIVKR